MYKEKDNDQISINSFYLAAFLLSKDVSLVNIEKEKFNRVNFIFTNSDKTQKLIRVFNFGDENDLKLQVNFKKTENAIKKLKSLIYD